MGISFLLAVAAAPTATAAAAPATSTGQEPLDLRDLLRDWHADLLSFVRHDMPKLLLILVVAIVLQRLVKFAVVRMRRLADRQVSNGRRASQLRTLATILRATAYSLLAFLVLLQVLPLFNIDLKPLLASAGVVGLGISFGAQSLFKDVLNGLFILVEDQFNVGDTIRVAGLTGTVEDLTLRVTVMRDGDGTQYTIPNSQITTVANLSREYSVASLTVSVDASADAERVMALLRQVALEVRQDPAFADVVVADPDVLGVERISGREVLYPVNFRVKPNQRDSVLRALRKRLLAAFEQERIPLGLPATMTVAAPAKVAAEASTESPGQETQANGPQETAEPKV